MRFVLLTLLAASAAYAQLPELYRSVPTILWGVEPDQQVQAWEKIGVPLTNGVSRFANVDIFWLKGKKGVYSLAWRAPSINAMQAETSRLGSLGVQVLERGELGKGVPYVIFDTMAKGKFRLGLMLDQPSADLPRSDLRITQFAFTAKNLDTISAYWASLGFPAFSFTNSNISDKEYRGRPGNFEMRQGWQYHTKVPFKWIEPAKGPSIYEDHIARYGEGIQHIAFNVDDLSVADDFWDRLGYPKSMSGAWGTEGKPGSGRFSYHDTHSIGGIDIELLWNYR